MIEVFVGDEDSFHIHQRFRLGSHSARVDDERAPFRISMPRIGRGRSPRRTRGEYLPLVRHLTVPAGAVRRMLSESPDGRLVPAALELVESVGLGDQERAVPQPARRLTARHS